MESKAHRIGLDRKVLPLLALFIAACTFLASLIPPLQSPDEFAHLQRAYLLTKGKFVLDRLQGASSGGMIDSGLLSYLSIYGKYIGRPDRKLSNDAMQAAAAIRWTGKRQFSQAPGVGFYLPLIYLPQAVGLAAAKKLDFTVDVSYRVARACSLVAVSLILLVAFSVHPTNPLVLALLVLPMSLFQFASTSLDGVSTALAIFSIAAFLRIAADGPAAPPWLFYTLALSIVLLATSRVHLLPMVLFILLAAFHMKGKRGYLIFALSVLAILGWLVLALKTTVDLRIDLRTPTSQIIQFYLQHPWSFVEVLTSTLADDQIVLDYRDSFLGNLGWLDTRLSEESYLILGWGLLLIAALSVSVARIRTTWAPRSVLVALALVSTLLVFFALLVTWTVHPAKTISGVQGRYFLVPATMLAYSLGGSAGLAEGIVRKVSLALVAAFFAYTMVDTTGVLLRRYYIAAEPPTKLSLVVDSHEPMVVAFAHPTNQGRGPSSALKL